VIRRLNTKKLDAFVHRVHSVPPPRALSITRRRTKTKRSIISGWIDISRYRNNDECDQLARPAALSNIRRPVSARPPQTSVTKTSINALGMQLQRQRERDKATASRRLRVTTQNANECIRRTYVSEALKRSLDTRANQQPPTALKMTKRILLQAVPKKYQSLTNKRLRIGPDLRRL